MRPYIYCFVVYHKQTFQKFPVGVEIYSIAFLYVPIVAHVVGSVDMRTNKARLISTFIIFVFFYLKIFNQLILFGFIPNILWRPILFFLIITFYIFYFLHFVLELLLDLYFFEN